MMESSRIPLYGVQLEDIQFYGITDWLINVKPVEPLWNAQPTYLISQLSFVVGAICTLIHAFSNGGRWPYLWLSTVLHGLVVESICFIHHDIDNFWHSQTPITFLGQRLPLHILMLYPCFIYQASAAVNRLKLPWWAEPFAVGATVVLIDMPYDIACVKFVHYTWHDTDPNIGDRHYWVPWNSYYFHCAFASSFTFWFHRLRNFKRSNHNKWVSSGKLVEFKSVLTASLLGAPGGVILFLAIYHPLHDIAGVHSEVTFILLFSLVLLVVWSGDRMEKSNLKEDNDGSSGTFLLSFSLAVHYLVYLLMVTLGKPENEISIGLHEPTGPCNISKPLHTAFGTVLHKRKYLCVEDYNEDYFDFSCTPNGPPKGIARWYTICGTPFKNRIEYIAIISMICIVAGVYFYNAHYRDIRKKNCNQSNKKVQ